MVINAIAENDVSAAPFKNINAAPGMPMPSPDQYRGINVSIPERFHGETRTVAKPTLLEFGDETVLCEPIGDSRSAYGVVLADGEKGAFFLKAKQQKVSIGRDAPPESGHPSAKNDWHIPRNSTSRIHGEFNFDATDVIYKDNNSSYGTGIQEVSALSDQPVIVGPQKKAAFLLSQEPIDVSVGTDVVTIAPDRLGYTYRIFDKRTGVLLREAPRGWVDTLKIGNGGDVDVQIVGATAPHEATLTITKNALLVKDTAWGNTVIRKGDTEQARVLVQQAEEVKRFQQEQERKKREISQTLQILSHRQLNTGEYSLTNVDKLERHYSMTEHTVGDFSFIYPEGKGYEHHFQDLLAISKTVDGFIANPLGTAKLPIKIILAPGSEYCARASAGAGVITMNFEEVNRRGTFAHEYTHEYLRQMFGNNYVPVLSEGAAMYFGQKAVSTDNGNNAEICAGRDEIKALLNLQKSIGPSNTKLVEEARPQDQLTDGQKYEYAYRLGKYFTGYLVEKYGIEAFRYVYAYASKPQLFDGRTGVKLIDKQQGAVASNREILDYLVYKTAKDLSLPGLSPDRMEAEFTEYIKKEMNISSQQTQGFWI